MHGHSGKVSNEIEKHEILAWFSWTRGWPTLTWAPLDNNACATLKLLAENYIVNWNCATVCENLFVNGGNPKIMIDKETD